MKLTYKGRHISEFSVYLPSSGERVFVNPEYSRVVTLPDSDAQHLLETEADLWEVISEVKAVSRKPKAETDDGKI